MFYQIEGESLLPANPDRQTLAAPGQKLGIYQFEEMESAAELFSLNLQAFHEDVQGKYSKFESHEESGILSVNLPKIWENGLSTARVVIYLSRGSLMLFFCDEQRLMRQMLDKVQQLSGPLSLERILCLFFNGLIAQDSVYLNELEQQITELEDQLIVGGQRSCVSEILVFRKKLMAMERYYQQLYDLLEDLLEEENHLVRERARRYLKMILNRADRVYHTVLNLRDHVTQVREAYQAQVDIALNSIMKIFTIVTAIFLPLTLIVGWYGMNLAMPEYEWRYGYLYVIGLSVAAVAIFIAYLKKKHLL